MKPTRRINGVTVKTKEVCVPGALLAISNANFYAGQMADALTKRNSKKLVAANLKLLVGCIERTVHHLSEVEFPKDKKTLRKLCK